MHMWVFLRTPQINMRYFLYPSHSNPETEKLLMRQFWVADEELSSSYHKGYIHIYIYI